MEIRTLRAFVEVVRQGGFSQAAKTVFATQSTVSKAVKQLEDEIGTPLLDRIGHRSKLMAAGEIVYRRAQRILAERDDLIAELGELRGLKRGTLRLGLVPVGSGTLFAPLFAIYRKRYPGIDIRLVEYGSERLQEILLAGRNRTRGFAPTRVGRLRMERRPARAPDGSAAGGPHALAPPVRRPSGVAGVAVHSVGIRICTQPYHSGRLPPTRLQADCRCAQQPDRFHCGACRRRHGDRLSTADDRGAAQASIRRPRVARRSGHRLAHRHDLAARRLSHAAKAWLDLVATTRGKK